MAVHVVTLQISRTVSRSVRCLSKQMRRCHSSTLTLSRTSLTSRKQSLHEDVSALTTYSFKPQLKTLGRRFGKNINAVREILAGLDGQAAMAELKEKGTLTIQVEGVDEALAEEDLLIEAAQMEGYVSDRDHGVTVVLDTNLTPELFRGRFCARGYQ